MFDSKGTFHYGPGMRAVLLVDQGIADFYLALVPKSIKLNNQFYPAHVSTVRREIPPKMELWGAHEGEEIPFQYSPIIVHDETYYWLDVNCERLQQIRIELGLPAFPPWRNLYHITIGNCKNGTGEE